MNNINLVGYLGKEPTFSEQNNIKTTKVSLATNEYYTEEGERKQITDWHHLVFKGPLAQAAYKYLKKGSLVAITGKYRSIKDGNKTYNYVQVTEYQLLGASPEKTT